MQVLPHRVVKDRFGSAPRGSGRGHSWPAYSDYRSVAPQFKLGCMSSPDKVRTPRRNDPCPCGSGKRFKHCHGSLASSEARAEGVPAPVQSIDQALAQARQLFENGAFSQAEKLCVEILSRKPRDVRANTLLGLCRHQLHDDRRARPCLERAVKLDPGDVDAQAGLARVLRRTGDLQNAEAHARRALELNPEAGDPLVLLGRILVDAQKFSEADTVLQQALTADGNNADSLEVLGDLRLAQRKFADARMAYERALAMTPERVQTLNGLGLVFLEVKEFENAQDCFEKSMQLAPKNPEIAINLGRVASAQGQPDSAHTWYLTALEMDNRFALAYVALSVLAMRRGNLQESIAWLRRGVAACPDDAILHGQLAERYAAQQDFTRAYEQIKEVERIAGDGAFTEKARAEVFDLDRKTEQAAAAFDRALAFEPHDAELLIRVSHFEEKRNRYDAAAELAARAFALDPSRQTQARVLAARAARRRHEYEKADAELEHLEIESLPLSQQSEVWYELGNLRDEQGQYPEAFRAFTNGAQAARRAVGLGFDLQAALTGFQRIRGVLSPDVLKNLSRFTGAPERKSTPIFVVGFMRSGTTLMEQILGSHPAVQAGGELLAASLMSEEAGRRFGKPVPDCLPLITGEAGQAELARSRNGYLDHVRHTGLDPDRPGFFTDKMPLNLLFLPLISMVFPESPVVHIRRNPMDCVFSNFVSNFGSVSPWAYDLDVAAAYFKGVMELADYFRENLPMRYHELRYEDLVADPEPQIREVAEFVGLPWDDSMMRFYENKRIARTPSYAQVNQPIYRRSVERYRNYEKFLEKPLAILEPMMRRYGYVPESD
jgi:tetratricopeptide (TPR) repeat protein